MTGSGPQPSTSRRCGRTRWAAAARDRSADGGWILYRDLGGRDLGGLYGAALDRAIARQVSVFAARGEAFEWKLHGHDQPRDLAARLVAAGFVAEPTETVVIAPIGELSLEP